MHRGAAAVHPPEEHPREPPTPPRTLISVIPGRAAGASPESIARPTHEEYFARPQTSPPELVGKVMKVLADHVEAALRLGFAGAGAAFTRPADMAGAQAELLGRRQVARMRGAHHDLLGLEVERLAGRQVDLRLRLAALSDLRGDD